MFVTGNHFQTSLILSVKLEPTQIVHSTVGFWLITPTPWANAIKLFRAVTYECLE
jgi:hypothetical protein